MRVLILVPVGITNSASHTSTYAQVRQQVDLTEVLTPVKSSRLPHSRRKKKAPCEGILSPRPESKTKPAFYAGFDFGSSGYNEFGVAYVNVCPWGRSVDCNVSQSGPIFVAVSQIGARNQMHMDRILFWSGQVHM